MYVVCYKFTCERKLCSFMGSSLYNWNAYSVGLENLCPGNERNDSVLLILYVFESHLSVL